MHFKKHLITILIPKVTLNVLVVYLCNVLLVSVILLGFLIVSSLYYYMLQL